MYVRVVLDVLPAPESLTTDERSQLIEDLVVEENVQRRIMLAHILHFDRAQRWKKDGYDSMNEWLVARFGMLLSTANEFIRAAQLFDTNKLLADAYAKGRTTWDQVLAYESRPTSAVGTVYRQADEHLALSGFDPRAIDPALVERSTRAHARIQNELATTLCSVGIEPRSPSRFDPSFDLAWQLGQEQFVAEVKSLTSAKESKQLRLGLGQLLWLQHVLSRSGKPTHGVLAIEHQPSEEGWFELCGDLGIALVWPEMFAEWLRACLERAGIKATQRSHPQRARGATQQVQT